MRTEHGYRKRRRTFAEQGQAHYLTFSCFRRQRFLQGARACEWLVEAIAGARVRAPFALWAWVFMPTHVHLLLRPRAGVPISRVLSTIKVPVARRAAAFVRRDAPAFLPRMLDVRADGARCLRFRQRGGE